MKESQLIIRFRNLLTTEAREKDIQFFFYKIPDCKGLGSLRPFDAFLLIQGKFFALEFKTETGIIKPHQKHYLSLVKKSGGIFYIVRESDYKKIIKELIRKALTVKSLMIQYQNSFRHFKYENGKEREEKEVK